MPSLDRYRGKGRHTLTDTLDAFVRGEIITIIIGRRSHKLTHTNTCLSGHSISGQVFDNRQQQQPAAFVSFATKLSS